MPEIKCPKCGEVFTVDESGYAAIIGQVRNAEFHKELHEREAQLAKERKTNFRLLKLRRKWSKNSLSTRLNKKLSV